MSEVILFAIGCGIFFVFLAGAYVSLQQRLMRGADDSFAPEIEVGLDYGYELVPVRQQVSNGLHQHRMPPNMNQNRKPKLEVVAH